MSVTEKAFHYSYTSAGYTNPSVQKGLDQLCIKLLTGLEDVQWVCDLGCGNGRLTHDLSRKGYAVIGVDSSVSGIDLAAGELSGEQAHFVCAEIDAALPAQLVRLAPLFDAVISTDVIEHLYRPRVLPDVAARILRPGGYLILGTPYHGYLKNLAISVLGKWDQHHTVDWDGGHIKFFSVRTLRRMVEDCGFQIMRFAYFGRGPFLWKNMICIARKVR